MFSRDGRWLAAARSDPALNALDTVLWHSPRDGAPFTESARLPHRDGVLAVAFSQSNRLLMASGGEDRDAIIWAFTNATWRPLVRPLPCGGQVYACAFSRNGRWLATAYRTWEAQQDRHWHSQVRIWDTATGEAVGLPMPLPATATNPITRLAFVAADTRLFVERWAPPSLPQRWITELPSGADPAEDYLRRTELLAAQEALVANRTANTAAQSAAESRLTLTSEAGFGRRLPLSREQCEARWRTLINTPSR
jgi:WD40 repeat protein